MPKVWTLLCFCNSFFNIENNLILTWFKLKHSITKKTSTNVRGLVTTVEANKIESQQRLALKLKIISFSKVYKRHFLIPNKNKILTLTKYSLEPWLKLFFYCQLKLWLYPYLVFFIVKSCNEFVIWIKVLESSHQAILGIYLSLPLVLHVKLCIVDNFSWRDLPSYRNNIRKSMV